MSTAPTDAERNDDAAVQPIQPTSLLGQTAPLPLSAEADKSDVAPAAAAPSAEPSPTPVPTASGHLPAKVLRNPVDDAPAVPPALASARSDSSAEPAAAIPAVRSHKDLPRGTSTLADIPTVDENGVPLSKSARKKMLKRKHFQETRAEWKAMKKEKDKAAKIRKRKAEPEEAGEDVARAKKARIKQTVLHPITIVLDCGFDELMTDKEVTSMSAQLVRCYSANRKSVHQCSLAVTSLDGRLGKKIRSAHGDQMGQWKNIAITEAPYAVPAAVPAARGDLMGDGEKLTAVKAEEAKTAVEKAESSEHKSFNGLPALPLAAKKEDLIYLTADSAETITTLEEGKHYIVGGIVDRNRHKNLCYNKAIGQGLRTAKLPIGDYLDMSSRHVLTTNQVVEIMIKYLETRDWKKAFISVIPLRKGAVIKSEGAEGEQTGEDGEDEGEANGDEEKQEDEDEKDEKDDEMTDADAGITEGAAVEDVLAEDLPAAANGIVDTDGKTE